MDKVTLPSLTPRTLKRGLVALFVLLSILQMASLFKHRDPAPLPDVARPSTLLSPSSPDIPNDFSLFGVAPEEADASARKAERPDALPLTSLRLALTGVLLSEDAAHSIAIFSKDNQQFSCSTNESLPYDDAKLVEIHADSVTLLYQGRHEVLRLYEQPGGEETQTDTAALQQLQPRPSSPISDYLELSPLINDNKLSGYRISPGRHPDIFYRVGLQERDVIIALNGLDLRDEAQAKTAMERIPEIHTFTLTVEREGQQQDIYMEIGGEE
ncbi:MULTISPECIES: type II secretion system protein GspC [Lonsdalea]|uniref:Uncharacterized protein n=2 Tax=Lonsdalea TaxID=1082702 RepID=A0ACD1JHA9_9GAMM|nr:MULTISPECIES: type II secretion system protein GspC [Lonsdalea]OSN02186.1 hypothetical protein AU499_03255 [Lonsdalea populi]QPQ23259.1 type II secretion system protein GspC [Lonsdalea populi]RAT15963.1 hypothetical protein AU485_02500 [Lonsdalea quercina]RAT18742.1 hypothetical protein AU486_00230 [Lonsdalea quercina]RAT23553.1 hypothetical protein AU487_01100 [Lonsdalea populi]